MQPLHWNVVAAPELADVGEDSGLLAMGKEKWQDLVVSPLVASKDALIAWLLVDKVTKATGDASEKPAAAAAVASLPEDEEAIPDNIDHG